MTTTKQTPCRFSQEYKPAENCYRVSVRRIADNKEVEHMLTHTPSQAKNYCQMLFNIIN